MEKKGYVSLWLGNCQDYNVINSYLSVVYTEDGNIIDSNFEKDFHINWFDEDLREAFCNLFSTSDIRELLKGCSYENSVIPAFINSVGSDINKNFNAGFLLYNFKYSGEIKEVKKDNICLTYIGSVRYETI